MNEPSSPLMVPTLKGQTSRAAWHRRVWSVCASSMDVCHTRKLRCSSSAWRFTIFIGLLVTTFSFLCNVVLLGVGLSRIDPATGNSPLFNGQCSVMQRLDTLSHVGINTLSTLLLGASNAAMQCLCAPTRKEIDKSHAVGKSADIGISSIQNWHIMSRRRKVLWILLGISSLPIHLVYNSAIVSVTSSYDWLGLIVTENFTTGAPWNETLVNNAQAQIPSVYHTAPAMQQAARNDSLQYLDRSQCKSSFSSDVVSSYTALLLILRDNATYLHESNSSLISAYSMQNSDSQGLAVYFNFTTWTNTTTDQVQRGSEITFSHSSCNSFWPPQRDSPGAANSGDLKLSQDEEDLQEPPTFKDVNYCLAQSAPQHCSIELLPHLLAVIVILNAVKILCIAFLLFSIKDNPLMTLGDAMASFLLKPDHTHFTKHPRDLALDSDSSSPKRSMTKWDNTSKAHDWFSGVSKKRWLFTSWFCVTYWMAGTIFTFVVVVDDWTTLWNVGIGTTITDTVNTLVIQSYPTITQNIIVANSVQMILSLAYLCYNGVFTCMLLSLEFTNFAHRAKALRVSNPQGAQRRTFWLTLPYRFSVPLLIMSSLLHWLLSEAMFLQIIDVSSAGGPALSKLGARPTSGQFSLQGVPADSQRIDTVMINGEAMTVLAIVGLLLLCFTYGVGFRKYAPGIPIVRSNSLAIAAACHLAPGERDAVFEKLSWGVIGRDSDGDKFGFRRSSFESRESHLATQIEDFAGPRHSKDLLAEPLPLLSRPGSLTAELRYLMLPTSEEEFSSLE